MAHSLKKLGGSSPSSRPSRVWEQPIDCSDRGCEGVIRWLANYKGIV